MISRLRYTLREMWASMSRNKTLTAATIITSTIRSERPSPNSNVAHRIDIHLDGVVEKTIEQHW